MRSVVVVLPASMCAAMPMFLILSSGMLLAIKTSKPESFSLPPVMCEGLVGFSHAVNVVSLFNRAAAKIGGVVQFVSQLLAHALLRTRAGLRDDPPHGERSPAILRHFDRHLIVCAA